MRRGLRNPSAADRKAQPDIDQLTRERDEALEREQATAEVLRVISSSPGELEAVFQAILENAVRFCEASFGMLFRFEGGAYRAVAMIGVPPAFAEFWQRGPRRPDPRTGLGRIAATRQSVHITDAIAEPGYAEGEPIFVAAIKLGGFRTALGVPMVKDENLIGAIFVYRQEVRPFTDKQIALVQNFANQAVIAIENARLLDETREALERQTATSDILNVIAGSPTDTQPVFDAIARSAAELCEGKNGGVFRLQDGLVHLAGHHNLSPEQLASVPKAFPAPPHRGYMAGRAILDRAIAHVPDIATDPEYDAKSIIKAGFRSTVSVPMFRNGEPVGAINVTREEARPFSERQIELLRTFADQAVIAISNVELFQQLQERTRELSQSLDDLRAAQDRLVQTEKLASLGQLTAGIAHEIKNPLNFVNNFSALSAELTDELNDMLKPIAMDGKVRGEVDELTGLLKDNLGKVVQHGKRADSIVKNMLQHSRESSGERRSADINALVGESLNLAYHAARAEKPGFAIMLKQDLDPDAGALDLYPQEITRALLNLISNGFYAAVERKAATDDSAFEPTLSAATRNLGETVEIRIRDNGSGIPPDVREKMFNPFFTTKPTGEGTGLGLSMTHDIIVKQHGGRINVETEPGTFTEFIVTLPRGNGNAGGLKSE